MVRRAKNIVSDLRVGGVRFCYSGLAAYFRSVPFKAALPGGGSATVRPRESDFATIRQVFRDKEYDIGNGLVAERVSRRYRQILAKGKTPVIIDAGANIGAAALWFGRQYPEASVVAIEPDPGNARVLRANLSASSKLIVLEAAIGSEPGYVSMIPGEHSWGVQTERSDAGCPIVTIDQAAEQVENGSLFLVKIDIEGFESDLFASNTDWLDRAAAVYLEPHDWKLPDQATSRTFQAEFGKRDFDIFLRGENLIYVRREH